MIIVDLETTGLLKPHTQDPAQQPGIVQVGLARLDDDFTPAYTKVFLVNPEMPIEQDAVKVHGITAEQVAGAPTLPALLPELANIFRQAGCWVGFNNSFDRQVLYYNLLRYGWEMRFPWPSRDLDVMKIGRDILNIAGKRDVKYPSLMEMHTSLFGEGFSNAHDALEDVLATARCARKLHADGII